MLTSSTRSRFFIEVTVCNNHSRPQEGAVTKSTDVEIFHNTNREVKMTYKLE